MKTHLIIKLKKIGFTLVGVLLVLGCQNDDKDLQEPKFSKTAEIFTDTPIGMGTNFYFPYAPGPDNPVGSKLNAWSVDQNVSYKGNASMRFDVPNENDPQGNYAGGIFRIDGAGRDLSGYDALTFWAKASQGVTIAEFGFGEDFYPNKYITTLKNVSLGTAWTKYIIPIPDASKLEQEKGMLRYAANTIDTNGKGYTFWIDELKFEKLGTIAHSAASILGGKDVTDLGFVKGKVQITGLSQTVNLGNGSNVTVEIAPAYFNFISSNPAIATVSETGLVSILAPGLVTITATKDQKQVSGSLTLTVSDFVTAPTPTLNPADVISLYSDVYTNVNVDYFNGYWAPWQTTESSILEIASNKFIKYSNFNFVGIEFSNPTVNATNMSYLHMDVYTTEPIVAETALYVDLINKGATNTRGSFKFDSTFLQTKKWNSLEIPVSIISEKNNVFQIILNAPASLMKNIYVDNIYFHK